MMRTLFGSGFLMMWLWLPGISQPAQSLSSQASPAPVEKQGAGEKKPILRLYDVTAPPENRVESPEEAEGYLRITQAKDPKQRVEAMEGFLQKYPQSIHFNRVHQWAVYQYQEMNEIDKMISHGEIALAAYGEDPTFLSTMAMAYNAKGIPQRAIELGEKAIALLEKAVMPPQSPPEQWNAERNQLLSVSRAAVGSAWMAKFEQARSAAQSPAASQEGNPAGAAASVAAPAPAGKANPQASPALPVEFLEKGERFLLESLQLTAQYDYALFQLGILYVYQNQANKAIDAFAKAVATGGGFAKPSRQNLEYVYKLTHNNSLEGLEQVIARAKAALSSEPATVPVETK
jgi:tetratricopeptide (TPR) repeat protein